VQDVVEGVAGLERSRQRVPGDPVALAGDHNAEGNQVSGGLHHLGYGVPQVLGDLSRCHLSTDATRPVVELLPGILARDAILHAKRFREATRPEGGFSCDGSDPLSRDMASRLMNITPR
jgi:hypothetical protein